MPRFVGNAIPGSQCIEDNAEQTPDRVRLTYSQAVRLPASEVMCSLDTTDQGSMGRKAKHWYRWFASPASIEKCPTSTANMLDRASRAATLVQKGEPL